MKKGVSIELGGREKYPCGDSEAARALRKVFWGCYGEVLNWEKR